MRSIRPKRLFISNLFVKLFIVPATAESSFTDLQYATGKGCKAFPADGEWVGYSQMMRKWLLN